MIFEKELLAIKLGIKNFHIYIAPKNYYPNKLFDIKSNLIQSLLQTLNLELLI